MEQRLFNYHAVINGLSRNVNRFAFLTFSDWFIFSISYKGASTVDRGKLCILKQRLSELQFVSQNTPVYSDQIRCQLSHCRSQ
jgi:hypothetical protein